MLSAHRLFNEVLGNLLALLERQDIPEYAAHRVWFGSAIRRP